MMCVCSPRVGVVLYPRLPTELKKKKKLEKFRELKWCEKVKKEPIGGSNATERKWTVIEPNKKKGF